MGSTLTTPAITTDQIDDQKTAQNDSVPTPPPLCVVTDLKVDKHGKTCLPSSPDDIVNWWEINNVTIEEQYTLNGSPWWEYVTNEDGVDPTEGLINGVHPVYIASVLRRSQMYGADIIINGKRDWVYSDITADARLHIGEEGGEPIKLWFGCGGHPCANIKSFIYSYFYQQKKPLPEYFWDMTDGKNTKCDWIGWGSYAPPTSLYT